MDRQLIIQILPHLQGVSVLNVVVLLYLVCDFKAVSLVEVYC